MYTTLAKLVVELKVDRSRVFNMDETAFPTKKKSNTVEAVRRSINV